MVDLFQFQEIAANIYQVINQNSNDNLYITGGRMKYITALMILLFSSSAFAVGAPDFLPDGPHPRIWLTSSELSRLTALRDAGNPKWITLESWCDTHINDAGYNVDPPDQSKQDLVNWSGNNQYNDYRMGGFTKHLYSYSLAYQILKQNGSHQNTTKANLYAARARTLIIDGIAIALRAGEENNGLKALRVASLHDVTINLAEAAALGISSYGYKNAYSARYLMAVPVSYDWIYDTLSSDDKILIRNMLLRWLDWSRGKRSRYNNGVLKKGIRYYEDRDGDCTGINNCTSYSGQATQGYSYNKVGNNFAGGLSAMTSLISVATYGDYAEDTAYLSSIKSDLDTYIIAPLENDLMQSGGDATEGWNYGGGFWYVLPALYGYYTATGDTAISSMNWPKALIRANLHRVSGNFISVPLWGYWTGIPMKESRIGAVSTFVGIEQKLRPTSNESKLGQFLLDTPTYTGALFPWENLFYTSQVVTANSPIALSEPLSYLAKGNGLYVSRSSWNEANAVHVTARLEGKVSFDHEGYDEGHITLLRGADVLLGHQNTVGDTPPSVSFNTIVFNGTSHWSSNPTQTSPSIDRYINTSDYSYVSGDITNAWKRQFKVDGALLFRRSLLHIRPGIIVVSDVTRSNSAVGNLKEWYTQYEADPTVSSDTITVTNGGSKAFVKSLYPAGSFAKTNPATGYYRVKYVPTTTQEYAQFLHVIETGSSTATQTPTTLITGTGGRGALIGNTVAMFTNDQAGGNVSTMSYSTDALTHYVCDLSPLTEYTLKVSGSNTLDRSVISTKAGVVTFDLPIKGLNNISLSISGAPQDLSKLPLIFDIQINKK